MHLTPEQETLGRRNFLKALAGTPALAALGAAAAMKGPVRGGPVKVGFVGVGAQGRVLLTNTEPAYADVRALCDINPASLEKRSEEHTSELQSRENLVCRLLLEKKKLEEDIVPVSDVAL